MTERKKVVYMLHRYGELLWVWVWREIRVRYKQSILGIAWALLQPLSLMLLFSFVFTYIVKIDTGKTSYPLFVYTALLPWSFFSSAIALGVPSLVNNMSLVTKVKMPREVIPMAAVVAGVVDFFIAAMILLGMMFFYQVEFRWEGLWLFPILALQVVLTLAVVLLGSAAMVLYRDVRFLIPLVTQLWMYATPIVYPLDMVPDRFRTFYYLNPMVGIIDGYRRSILGGQPPDFAALGISFVVSVLLFVLAYCFFKRVEPSFADLI